MIAIVYLMTLLVPLLVAEPTKEDLPTSAVAFKNKLPPEIFDALFDTPLTAPNYVEAINNASVRYAAELGLSNITDLLPQIKDAWEKATLKGVTPEENFKVYIKSFRDFSLHKGVDVPEGNIANIILKYVETLIDFYKSKEVPSSFTPDILLDFAIASAIYSKTIGVDTEEDVRKILEFYIQHVRNLSE